MKAKHVFMTLGLAFSMGIGVAASIGFNNNIQPVKAEGVTTLYLDTNHLTWYGDQSRAYLYGDSQNNTWPGQPLTYVSGSLYKLEVANMSDYHSVIFLRSNGTDVWNRTSKNGGTGISLPTDWSVANKFTFNSGWDGNVEYDDGNYTGGWSFYDDSTKYTVNTVLDKWGTETVNGSEEVVDGEPIPTPGYDFGYHFSGWYSDDNYTEGNEVTAVTSDITVYGKITKVATKSFSLDASLAPDFSGKMGVAIYAWEPSGKTNASWPGVSTPIWAGSITLPEDASLIVCNGTDTSAEDFTQTVDVSFASAIDGDTLILLDSKDGSGKVETAWESEGTATNNYTVKCGTNTYSFTLADDGKPEGVAHQFKATISEAYRAEVLTFYQNGTLVESKLGVDYQDDHPAAGNNIVGDLENGFRVYHRKLNMEIYLKLYSDGGRSLWGTGYEEEVFKIKTDAAGTVERAYIDNDFVPSGDYVKQYKSAAIDFVAETQYFISEDMGATQKISIETGDNNAKPVEGYNSRFEVFNACSESIYIKIKADLSLTIWVGGKYHARTLNIGGVEHQMEVYEEEGQPLQYRLTNVDLKAGQIISFSYDGEPVDITAKAIGNNNLTSDLKILADAEGVDIYLDPAAGTLWVGGLGDFGGYHLLVINETNETTTFVRLAINPNNNNEYFIAAYEFLSGDKIKIVYCNNDSALPTVDNPAGGLNQYSHEAFILNDQGEVTCSSSVTVNAYIQLSYGADKLYFGSVPDAVPNALTFVDEFKSHMRNCCAQDNPGPFIKSAFKNQIVPAYNELSDEAKAILNEGSDSPYEKIREFAERYIYFIQKFGTQYELQNFMGWDIPTASNQVANMVMNNNVILITIVSAMILTSSVGLFFIIKRKKFEK